jgi:hypothetical protein
MASRLSQGGVVCSPAYLFSCISIKARPVLEKCCNDNSHTWNIKRILALKYFKEIDRVSVTCFRMTMSLKLYGSLLSQPSRAVELFLWINKIPYQSILIDVLKGKLIGKEFKKLYCKYSRFWVFTVYIYAGLFFFLKKNRYQSSLPPISHFSPLNIHNKIINIRTPNTHVFFINMTLAKKFVEFSI